MEERKKMEERIEKGERKKEGEIEEKAKGKEKKEEETEERCEECGGRIIKVFERGKYVCRECGLTMKERIMVRTAIENEEKERKEGKNYVEKTNTMDRWEKRIRIFCREKNTNNTERS